MHESDLRLAGVLKLRGYRRQVRTNAAPFWVSLMHESDLRSAGVLKLQGYRQQVRMNAARKFIT